MPIECPRCLQTNLDSTLTCECGYDLASNLLRRRLAPETVALPRPTGLKKEMRRRDFLFGISAIWMALSIGEWVRIRPQLLSQPAFKIIHDSVLVGLTDLAGALSVGALGWVTVWVLLAYEGSRRWLCPKRVTLSVTCVAAGLLFIARTTNPAMVAQHLLHGLIVLAIAAFCYFAGSRAWLGKW